MPQEPLDDRDRVVGWEDDEMEEREDMFWDRSIVNTTWQDEALQAIQRRNQAMASRVLGGEFSNVTFRGNSTTTDNLPMQQSKETKKYHPNRDERLAKHSPKSDGERRTENVPLSNLSL